MNDKECQEFLKTVCAGGEASTLRASDCGKRTRGRQVPFLKDRKVVTSLCHGNKISGSQQTEVLQIWQKKKKTKKNDMHAVFPVHDGTREQNSSPYLASIVRQ